jgi:hypothetical protein
VNFLAREQIAVTAAIVARLNQDRNYGFKQIVRELVMWSGAFRFRLAGYPIAWKKLFSCAD